MRERDLRPKALASSQVSLLYGAVSASEEQPSQQEGSMLHTGNSHLEGLKTGMRGGGQPWATLILP